ncbi:hypothetical protein LCGC14_0940110 [marine sediment metagenome]|uniref:PD-(D/E)XK endonuclease-like domain-containing protein n=1 Tax=marine sediment metagenome TaxID=412755 RepID=A0A0F9RRN4_9ZZZZ
MTKKKAKRSVVMKLSKLSASHKASRKAKRRGLLWKGPEVDGITQSMLSRFLMCRERFRVLVVDGLRPVDTFNHRIEYGSMWHICEEAFTKNPVEAKVFKSYWAEILRQYAKKLCRKYPLQQEQIQHWYNVCKIQFPIYLDYWAKHKVAEHRVSLLQEQTFSVPYQLPCGRVVKLRGKWDGVDLIGKGRNAGVYLVEHKTKGDINEEQIKQQFQFDLQMMFYLVALDQEAVTSRPDSFLPDAYPIKGVMYNVVRRPLSGGKGSIRRHKATKTKPEETVEHFYSRLAGIIAEEPATYFMRWKVEVTQQDVLRFKREFLTPILEQLCDWWAWVSNDNDLYGRNMDDGRVVHWRTPFGMYNVLAEGGATDLDEHLATGSTLGLEHADSLFRELG